MKKLNKKYIKWFILLGLVLIVVITYGFNIYNIKNKTVDKISSLTIPFSLIVNPKNIDDGLTPKSISLKTGDMEKTKEKAIGLVATINEEYENNKSLDFLSTDQKKSLIKRINKKSHRYIFKMTLLNFGRDTHGNYITISCNRYDDTKNIVSYRYRLYYSGEDITSAKYLNTKTNLYPPKYVLADVELGSSGIDQAKSFIQRVKTTIINSNLTMTNATDPGDFNQLSLNLGLDADNSNNGLYNLARNSNSRVTNFGIVGYQLSDVPRYSRIYLKQQTKNKIYYYTLTYDRNNNKFIQFQRGIISTDTRN
ncbi:hypothetical protein M5C72_00085 [Companilactobacillus allii]|uniref:Uncharacterized protein n=1 Tax=Companilactobacillus allii TaxID=1847728 RepID=A0A1P8Q141_9LACO|nr:hypothetical protein [Companilactobacillus allii]APX71593.1 hypothetical protein BTM29_03025 [Companilactobacillus allii]USQ68674.1 hypothetical protein M5C72_00085 [Companilactobacillus allii]